MKISHFVWTTICRQNKKITILKIDSLKKRETIKIETIIIEIELKKFTLTQSRRIMTIRTIRRIIKIKSIMKIRIQILSLIRIIRRTRFRIKSKIIQSSLIRIKNTVIFSTRTNITLTSKSFRTKSMSSNVADAKRSFSSITNYIVTFANVAEANSSNRLNHIKSTLFTLMIWMNKSSYSRQNQISSEI